MPTIKAKAVLSAVRNAVAIAGSKISAAQAAAAAAAGTPMIAAKHKAAASRAQGKAYELRVLVHVLQKMHADGYVLSCTPKGGVLTFGGSPCRPNLPQHDWICAKKGNDDFQVWVSVQFRTLSHSLRSKPAAVWPSDKHEIDVGVYRVLVGKSYPTLSQVIFAASCKTGGWSKAYVREALGLRRELGFLDAPRNSLAQWYTDKVWCNPAVPLVLYSSNSECTAFKSLEHMGLYVEHLP